MGCYEKMIPSPKLLCDSDSYCLHNTTISGDFGGAIEVFKEYTSKAHGLDFTEGNDFIIRFDSSLDDSEYCIRSATDKVD